MISPAMIEILNVKSKEAEQRVKKVVGIVLIIALVIIGLFVGKAVWKKLHQTTAEDNAEDETNPNKLTYKESDYDNFVATLKNAMIPFGTVEEDIIQVLNKLKTKDDWLKTFTVFGIVDGMNLTEWILDEVTGSDLETIRNILSKINVSI